MAVKTIEIYMFKMDIYDHITVINDDVVDGLFYLETFHTQTNLFYFAQWKLSLFFYNKNFIYLFGLVV